MKENLKQLRQKQEEAKMKAAMDAQPKDAPFKLTKFQKVESKLNRTGLKYSHEQPKPAPERRTAGNPAAR
jgi:hypothetical protein